MRIKESSIHCHPDDHVQRFTTVPVQNPVKLVAFRHLANCQGQPVSQLKPEKEKKVLVVTDCCKTQRCCR